MKKILKEIASDFKRKPIQNTIGWLVVVPVGIPFIIINYFLLATIWFLKRLRLIVIYPMAKLILSVENINK